MGCSASSQKESPPDASSTSIVTSPPIIVVAAQPLRSPLGHLLSVTFMQPTTNHRGGGGERRCDDALQPSSSTPLIREDRHMIPSVGVVVAVIVADVVVMGAAGVISEVPLLVALTAGTDGRGGDTSSFSMEVSNAHLVTSMRAQAGSGSVGQFSISDAPLVDVALLSGRELW